MTDDQLELRLRDWYHAEIPADETAPAALRSSLAAIPAAGTPSRRFASRRGITLLAAAALVGLLAGTAAVGGLLRPPSSPPPAVWTATGGMINNHVAHTATLLPDGTVLVTGAPNNSAPTSAELYDPSTGSWAATGDMTSGRVDHTATLLPDGRVLVTGGGGSGAERSATAELYDPGSGSWTATGSMIWARSAHTATLLPDGRVLVAGGAADPDLATAELYDPRTGTWTATGNLVEGRSAHTATLLPDGTVLLAGGAASSELYDPRSGTWTATGAMIHARFDATATLLPDGTVLVAGDGEGATSAELYNPGSGTWTATGAMTQGRHSHLTATLLPDGTVLVAGGHSGVDLAHQELASAELYDPLSRTWTATASMATPRRYHTATLLPDGTVLVAGGAGGLDDDAVGSAELYHPVSAPSLVPPSPLPSADPSKAPLAGRIVFTRRVRLANGEGDCTTRFQFCHRSSVVISNLDGSNERELVPGPTSVVLTASADGSKLLVSIQEGDLVGLFLTDASASTPQRLEIPCEAPCDVDWSFALSPDGTRLAFVRSFVDETSVIAIRDMATGTVDELESTIGYAATPGWSPDGTRLAFANHVVDADGSNLQQIASDNLFIGESGKFSGGLAPSQWSHDGSFIAFTSWRVTIAPPDHGQRLMDVYVVRPDGTGLLRLTMDTAPPLGNNIGDFGATFPTWTSDGRIVFTRFPMAPEFVAELWVMGADGTNAKQLDPNDAAALTALGCIACTYPALTDYELTNFAYWIPGQ